jgi:hypothetical protein
MFLLFSFRCFLSANDAYYVSNGAEVKEEIQENEKKAKFFSG